jgi:hypothetical protein
MPAYHQMGNDSRNLISAVDGYAGAILSPVNEVESDITEMLKEHEAKALDFVFDPQLYFPKRSDRGKLATWSYFPNDFDTADMGSIAWWEDKVLKSLVATAKRVGATTVCAPATIGGSSLTDGYYLDMAALGDRTVALATAEGLRTIQTVIVRMTELATPGRAMEIASVVSKTKAAGIYLVLLNDVKPREELRDTDELKAAMTLISVLEEAKLPVLVAFSSSDVVLWKAAGATSCATGKFANLRRFSTSRFNEKEDGGSMVAYWFEEGLLAFIREADIARVQQIGLGSAGSNPFAAQILEHLDKLAKGEPSMKAWVGVGWRQYMWWFADVEKRLASGAAKAVDLVREAEANWTKLEQKPLYLDEKANTGGWLRPWLQSITEFNK